MFLMSLGFSIILTGVWPYLDKVCNIYMSNVYIESYKNYDYVYLKIYIHIF